MSTLRANIQITPQELFTSSSTAGTDLGALATTGDGRYFRYVKAGATTLVPGQVYQGPASDVVNFSPVGGLGVGQANATGTNSFTISTSTTLTANQLAGGTVSVAVTPGQGYNYKIKSNSATSGATGCLVTLEDPLLTNLSTASKVVLYPNPYNGVVVVGTASTGPIVGVAVYPVVNAQFGWVQTRGPVSALIGGTPGPGTPVGINLANVTGTIAAPTGVIFTEVGNMTATGASGEYDLVNLSME